MKENMDKIKRYNIDYDCSDIYPEIESDGEWCKWQDVEELQADNDALLRIAKRAYKAEMEDLRTHGYKVEEETFETWLAFNKLVPKDETIKKDSDD